MPCVIKDPDDPEDFVELDPSGRYGRYAELLGSGAMKKVYRAFDKEEGIEVAWNQVRLLNFMDDQRAIDRLYSEVEILRSLRHENIITFHHMWNNVKKCTLNFITEVCTSGNLREYRRCYKTVSLKAIKKWAYQILKGLEYLHSRNPCIIHRDINPSNVFINGNLGQVKIGDMGLAAIVHCKPREAHSLLGTPEFMAPELYEEKYDERVDIYSFGMSVLEIVTREIPYSECSNVVRIYKTVLKGIRPLALEKVTDLEVKDFIERCLGQPKCRPSASELLKDPFFREILEEGDVSCRSDTLSSSLSL